MALDRNNLDATYMLLYTNSCAAFQIMHTGHKISILCMQVQRCSESAFIADKWYIVWYM